MHRYTLLCVAASAVMQLCATAVLATDYPTRPVRLVVATAPGSAPDAVGRILAESMGATLGRTVIVDNRPGAANTIGARLVAQATPDGYTILFGTAAALAVSPQLVKAGYDPLTAFATIGLIQRGPYAVAVSSGLAVASVPQLIEYARAHPGKLAYSTPGVGSVHHLAWEMLTARTGMQLLHVPMQGGGPMLVEAVAGRIPLLLNSPTASLIQLGESGKLRFIGLTGIERLKQLPQVRTFDEQGLTGFEAYSWWGLVAPARTAPAIMAKLNSALNVALGASQVKERLAAEGVSEKRFATTPAEFNAWIRAEHAHYAKVIRDTQLSIPAGG